jgi:YidC/Oxa1 family membrane protein insertase
MVQHYFASAWLLPDGKPHENFARKIDQNLYAAGMITPIGAIAPGATAAVDARLFIGPQEEKVLESIAPGLELVKDYGFFTILSKPLYWLLDKLHGVIGNWGWAIVALVFLLKILPSTRSTPRPYAEHGQDEGHQPQGHGPARASTRTTRSRCRWR